MFQMRDREMADKIMDKIRSLDVQIKIMHVCGTHQDTLVKHGLIDMLADAGIDVRQGPGCPVCVTTPQEISLMDSRKAVAFAKKLNLKIFGIIENMSGLTCPHCGKSICLFKENGGKKASIELEVPFLGKIPIDPQIVISGDTGKPFISSHPDSDASQSLMRIVDKILNLNIH